MDIADIEPRFLEAGVFLVLCSLSALPFAVFIIVLYVWFRKSNLVMTGLKLQRVSSLFLDASDMLKTSPEGKQVDPKHQKLFHGLTEDGKFLEKVSSCFLCDCQYETSKRKKFKLPDVLSPDALQELRSRTEFIKYFITARNVLEKAGINYVEDIKLCEQLKKLKVSLQMVRNPKPKNLDWTRRMEKLLLTIYRLVFQQNVKEVIIAKPAGHIHDYIFAGYSVSTPYCYMVHMYCSSMLFVVFNWFILVFLDAMYERKNNLACSDPQVKNALICFDVNVDVSGPADCTTTQDPNVRLYCYFSSMNITLALSLAFGFTKLIIFLIQVYFKFTIWCVKHSKTEVVVGFHFTIASLFIIIQILYVWLVLNVRDLQHSVELNLFYGFRPLRFLMSIWGGVTIILITITSPYWWLIDKCHDVYYPVYGHKSHVFFDRAKKNN